MKNYIFVENYAIILKNVNIKAENDNHSFTIEECAPLTATVGAIDRGTVFKLIFSKQKHMIHVEEQNINDHIINISYIWWLTQWSKHVNQKFEYSTSNYLPLNVDTWAMKTKKMMVFLLSTDCELRKAQN